MSTVNKNVTTYLYGYYERQGAFAIISIDKDLAQKNSDKTLSFLPPELKLIKPYQQYDAIGYNGREIYRVVAQVEGWRPNDNDLPKEDAKFCKIAHKWTADLQGVDSQHPDHLEFEATEGFSNVTMKYIAGDEWTKPDVGQVIVKVEISDWDKTKVEVLSQGITHNFEMPNGREYEIVKLISAFWKLKKKLTGREWAEPARLINIQKNDKVVVTVNGKEYKVSGEKAEQLKSLLGEE